MKVEYFDVGYPYIVVDDFYDDNELDLIWRELIFLMDGDKLDYPDRTGGAGSINKKNKGVFLKKNKGVFLNEVFNDVRYSNIIQCNKKIIENFSELTHGSKSWSWFFSCFGSTPSLLDEYNTLISYYEGDDYYKPHWDTARITMCTWLYKEPKSFSGGDFILNAKTEHEHLLNHTHPPQTIKVKNNRMIIFPGMIPHGVTPLKMNTQSDCMGRFTISNFFSTHSS